MNIPSLLIFIAKNEVGKGIQDVCTNSSYSKIYLWGEVSYVICQQLIVVDESNQTSKCSLLREKLAVEVCVVNEKKTIITELFICIFLGTGQSVYNS